MDFVIPCAPLLGSWKHGKCELEDAVVEVEWKEDRVVVIHANPVLLRRFHEQVELVDLLHNFFEVVKKSTAVVLLESI